MIARGAAIPAFAVLACAALYAISLPVHTQGGDTPELVAAAHGLFVPHPPGYPLWIWLEHLWLRLVPLGTVFWRASLLNALFSVGTLALVAWACRARTAVAVLCVSVLGLSTAFSQSAVLPDVFALHGLLVAAIGTLYLFVPTRSRARQAGIPLFFFAGAAHHQTIVLLLPVFLAAGLESWREKGGPRRFLAGAGAGVAIACAAFASLLLLHPASAFSWGELDGASALLRHVLREDFGTLTLSPRGASHPGAGAILQLARVTLLELAAPLVAGILFFRASDGIDRRRVAAWAAACFLSVMFFALFNVAPVGMGAEVLLRFHVMPAVMLILLSGYLLHFARLEGVLYGVAIGGCLATAPVWLGLPGLHGDSIIENYAKDLLGTATAARTSLVLVEDDTTYFAARYAQSVLGRGAGVAVAVPSLFFHSWYFPKLRQLAPALELPQAGRISRERALKLEEELLTPNLEKAGVLVNDGYADGELFRVEFKGLGRSLSRGKGISFDESSLRLLSSSATPRLPATGPLEHTRNELASRYATYFLARGLDLHRRGDRAGAIRAWSSALDRAPADPSALSNLCGAAPEDPRCARH